MNRRVIITGASRGLGRSLAEKFAAAGDEVIGVSRTRKNWKALPDFPGAGKMPARAGGKTSSAGSLTMAQVDLTSEAQVKAFCQKMARQGKPVDILINNAGIGGTLQPVALTPLKDFEQMIRSNLTSAFLLTKHLIPVFRKQGNGGLILNISSMAGIRGVPKLFAYSASKYGMAALTQCVAKENSDTSLKCLNICPGGMNTEMRAALFGQKDADKQQSPDFVASVIMDIVEDRFPVASGSDVVIRHGKIFAVNPMPTA